MQTEGLDGGSSRTDRASPGNPYGHWAPEHGAGNRSRTYDLRITNALLYQLSYSGPRRGLLRPAAPPGLLLTTDGGKYNGPNYSNLAGGFERMQPSASLRKHLNTACYIGRSQL